jgi:hypothetical protein
LKKQAAGEGITLFGLLMTSDLAVFQNIVYQLNHRYIPWRMPIGKKIAPAIKKPQKPCAKQVKM